MRALSDSPILYFAHRLRLGLVFLAALFVALFFLSEAASAQQSNLVVVYNGGGTGYDAAAEGLAWQSAGFLGPDGAPLGTNANGDIVNGEGTVVGSAIKSGDKVIGWRNAATNVSIFDINQGTMADAFNGVTDSGTIKVIKHGQYTDTNRSGRPDDGDTLGGGLQLDGGRYFSGFGDGTGDTSSTPYDLPDRDGASIKMELVCCWSAADPDKMPGGKKPVTESAESVPGVDSATGTTGKSQAGAGVGVSFPIAPGKTEDEINKAIDDAFKKAKPGFSSVADWVNSLPFKDQLAKLKALLPKVTVKNMDVPLTWSIDYFEGGGNDGGAFNADFPQLVPTSEGGFIIHDTPSGEGLRGAVTILTLLDQDAFPDDEFFHLGRLGDLPAPSPTGLELVSGIYVLSPVDGQIEEIALEVSLDLISSAILSTVDVLALGESGWFPFFDSVVVDTGGASAALASLFLERPGFIFAAFGERIAAPPALWLLLPGLVLLAILRRRRR